MRHAFDLARRWQPFDLGRLLFPTAKLERKRDIDAIVNVSSPVLCDRTFMVVVGDVDRWDCGDLPETEPVEVAGQCCWLAGVTLTIC